MSEELKPCPFCGGYLTFIGHDIDRRVTPPEVVEVYEHKFADDNDPIKDCCLSLLVFAARRWNTRPVEDALTAERDRYKAALEEILVDEGFNLGSISYHEIARAALKVTR